MNEIITPEAQDIAALLRKERRRKKYRLSLVLPFFLDLVEQAAKAARRRPRYVQVGANDGMIDDPMRDRASSGVWDAVLIEPSSVYLSELKALYRDNPNVKLLKTGISDSTGTLDLFRMDERYADKYPVYLRGRASLDRNVLISTMRRSSEYSDKHIVAEQIQLEKLQTILGRMRVGRVDVLVVDVEGHEQQVFDSLDLAKTTPKLIFYEHKHLARADNRDLVRKFESAGYSVVRLRQDTLAVNKCLATPSLMKLVQSL